MRTWRQANGGISPPAAAASPSRCLLRGNLAQTTNLPGTTTTMCACAQEGITKLITSAQAQALTPSERLVRLPTLVEAPGKWGHTCMAHLHADACTHQHHRHALKDCCSRMAPP